MYWLLQRCWCVLVTTVTQACRRMRHARGREPLVLGSGSVHALSQCCGSCWWRTLQSQPRRVWWWCRGLSSNGLTCTPSLPRSLTMAKSCRWGEVLQTDHPSQNVVDLKKVNAVLKRGHSTLATHSA